MSASWHQACQGYSTFLDIIPVLFERARLLKLPIPIVIIPPITVLIVRLPR